MIKAVSLPGYNYRFDTETGLFARWGETQDQDPKFSPIGPEIADIEISTICHGPGTPCSFCYKSNTAVGENMSLELFKNIFSKIKKNLTQIAFGIGDIDGNPDMMSIFTYCRNNGVIPNVTINGYRLSYAWAMRLASVCGAVAVSHYGDGGYCYQAVSLLCYVGLKQVNIHKILSEETYEECKNIITDVASDKETNGRLQGLKAIVFLAIKPKGRAKNGRLNPISVEKLKELIRLAEEKGVGIGFDSCSAPKVLLTVQDHPNFSTFQTYVEPCESTLFSAYINVHGDFCPCSFTEGEGGWGTGISVSKCNDFLLDVWYNQKTVEFRKNLLSTEDADAPNCYSPCRKCPAYKIY